MANPATKGARVLVIDDSNTIRSHAGMMLTRAGYDVILAQNGFEAMAKVVQHRPDVILVDIMMPRMDGYQTCALLKRSHRHAATPIVMLSSKDSAFDRARGRMVGALAHLSKPFTSAQLLGAVEAQLSGCSRPSLDFSLPSAYRELRAA